jgi:hypothetical protein
VCTLLRRRYQLLMRDTGYLWLLLALTFGFPCVVVIFAIKGLPRLQGLCSGVYALSKLIFTGSIALLQGVWMAAGVLCLRMAVGAAMLCFGCCRKQGES